MGFNPLVHSSLQISWFLCLGDHKFGTVKKNMSLNPASIALIFILACIFMIGCLLYVLFYRGAPRKTFCLSIWNSIEANCFNWSLKPTPFLSFFFIPCFFILLFIVAEAHERKMKDRIIYFREVTMETVFECSGAKKELNCSQNLFQHGGIQQTKIFGSQGFQKEGQRKISNPEGALTQRGGLVPWFL